MARRKSTEEAAGPVGPLSALIDTRVIYCGDCLDKVRKLPDGCVGRPAPLHEAGNARIVSLATQQTGHGETGSISACSPFGKLG